MAGSGELVRWLVESWSERLAETVETMAGERPRIGVRPAATDTAAAGDLLWWEQPLSLGPQARVWVGAPEASWLELGKHTLRGAGIEPTDPADARSTYLEILNQALAGLAQSIGQRLGTAVGCENGCERAQGEPAAFETEVTFNEAPACLLYFGFAPALTEPFAALTAPAGAAEAGDAAPAEPVPAPDAELEPAAPSKTLDLLLDVELPVSVSFGRAQLALKDVLKLTTGSIVELNRAISEPVEVIVNNCAIARGEVVVIDGNYGVRIREILSREKRLRTLK